MLPQIYMCLHVIIHPMKNATVSISGVLALSFLAAGLIVLPDSVEDAQANPCSNVGPNADKKERVCS